MCACACTYACAWTGGRTDGRTDERTDGRMDGRTDGRTLNPSWCRCQCPLLGPLPHPYPINLPLLKDGAVGTAVHIMLLASVLRLAPSCELGTGGPTGRNCEIHYFLEARPLVSHFLINFNQVCPECSVAYLPILYYIIFIVILYLVNYLKLEACIHSLPQILRSCLLH